MLNSTNTKLVNASQAIVITSGSLCCTVSSSQNSIATRHRRISPTAFGRYTSFEDTKNRPSFQQFGKNPRQAAVSSKNVPKSVPHQLACSLHLLNPFRRESSRKPCPINRLTCCSNFPRQLPNDDIASIDKVVPTQDHQE